ncbi:MAG: response regulator transcription factor [Luteolibacter sp.]
MYSEENPDFDSSVKVGIIEGNRVLGENLRRAVDATPNTRCVGVWNTAEKGLRQIEELRPLVVLMDLDLPGTSGIEATRLLKRFLPDVQVMIVSLEADPERIAEAIKAGACGFLIKPTLAGDLGLPGAATPFDCTRTVTAMARRVIETLHKRSPKMKVDEDSVPLSLRETVVARLISEGLTNKEIAGHMDLGIQTVHSHIKTIFKKLSARSRTDVAVKYLKSLQVWNPGEGR